MPKPRNERAARSVKNRPSTKMLQIKNHTTGSSVKLLERKPDSETVVGSVSKRLASAILGGNWNDGGR